MAQKKYLFASEQVFFLALFQEHPQQLFLPLAIRLIPHFHINPGFLINNTLFVRERLKPNLSVISTHAAFSYAAKAHIGCGKVNYCIIYASSAEGAAGQYCFFKLFAACKQVQREWFASAVYNFKHFFICFVG